MIVVDIVDVAIFFTVVVIDNIFAVIIRSLLDEMLMFLLYLMMLLMFLLLLLLMLLMLS